MDRQRMQDYLGQVAAYRPSGKKASDWAAEQGVPLRSLASWCAHAGRWQARLNGVSPSVAAGPVGYVAARLPTPSTAGSVRVEMRAGTTVVALHWPTTHTRELAAWLRAMSR